MSSITVDIRSTDGYAPFSECIYIDHVFDVILGTINQHIILLLYVACCVLCN